MMTIMTMAVAMAVVMIMNVAMGTGNFQPCQYP